MKGKAIILGLLTALVFSSCESTETQVVTLYEEVIVVQDSIIDNTVVIPHLDVNAVGKWQSQVEDKTYYFGTNGRYKLLVNGIAVGGGALSSDVENEFLFLEGVNITYRYSYEVVSPTVLSIEGELFDRKEW